ncbi:MAG: GNAT family N-acetyltransferase [Actinomycetia bacterium]|nr:GNAT family N-acetyltransferase [Actinomycetes bacterium]
MELRPAGEADLAAIAALHTRSWLSAYSGLLPGAFLKEVPERHRRQWRELPGDGFVVVAEVGDSVVAFGSVRPGQGDGDDLLLDNLHVAPTLRGTGVGQKVLEAVLRRAAQVAPGAVLYLWVLERNEGARRFYRRNGGSESVARQEEFAPGVVVEERRVEWRLPVG